MKEKILELRAVGMTYTQIAKELKCSKSIVCYHCCPNQKDKTNERTKKWRIANESVIYSEFCQNCKKPNRKNRRFCSASCAAIIGNKTKKRQYKEHPCKKCGELCRLRYTHCKLCISTMKIDKENRTLSELKYMDGYKCNENTHVRERARVFAKKLGWNTCRNCGYNKFIQICHIKGIADFPDDAKLCEVNAESNLLPLCPNCHWEFDHDMLTLAEINRNSLS